jgi:poly(hydroxyalkanoate) granule-associated protein
MSKKTSKTPPTPKAILAKTTQKAQKGVEVVKETTQNIFLAGLGALTLAEDEGKKVFKALVKRGTAIDAKNQKAFSSVVKEVEARVEVVKENVVDATSGTVQKIKSGVEKVGSGVESGVASVMHTFGVPTRGEIQTLTRKVDALTKSVDAKAKSARKAPVRPAKKAHKAHAAHAAAASGTPAF